MKIALIPHDLIAPLTPEQVERVLDVAGDNEVIVPRTPEAAMEAVADAEVIFGDLPLDLLDAAPHIKWVQSVGAGVDKIAEHLRGRDVAITGAKGVVGPQLAEHAFALLLGLTRGVAMAIRRPGWEHRKEIRQTQWELTDRTICIVGLGGAGQALAKRARGFEFAKIIALEPNPAASAEFVDELRHPDDIDLVLPKADVVVLTVPLTPDNVGLFGAQRFAVMKPGAILINVSRGGLVQESPLVEALQSGHLGGAGLDVVPVEPLPTGHPLWSMPNVIITPHNAGGSPRRADRVVDGFAANLGRYLAGDPLDGLHDPARGF